MVVPGSGGSGGPRDPGGAGATGDPGGAGDPADRPDSLGPRWRGLHADLLVVERAVAARVASRTGLPGVQAEVITRLWRQRDRRSAMNVLAADLRVSGSSLTKLVDRLGELGLVRRDSSGPDRRVVHVVLTEEGLRQAEQVAELYLAAVRDHVLAAIGSDLLVLADVAARVGRPPASAELLGTPPDAADPDTTTADRVGAQVPRD